LTAESARRYAVVEGVSIKENRPLDPFRRTFPPPLRRKIREKFFGPPGVSIRPKNAGVLAFLTLRSNCEGGFDRAGGDFFLPKGSPRSRGIGSEEIKRAADWGIA
jgi:hypothetical protein